jgi:hypothetical protein
MSAIQVYPQDDLTWLGDGSRVGTIGSERSKELMAACVSKVKRSQENEIGRCEDYPRGQDTETTAPMCHLRGSQAPGDLQ